jgi:hypothetical protein
MEMKGSDSEKPSGSDRMQIEMAVNAARARLECALEARDIDAYMAVFLPDVVYERENGKRFGYEEIKREIAVLFAATVEIAATYNGAKQQLADSEAIELTEEVHETLWRETRFLGLFQKLERRDRKAFYVWVCRDGQWWIKQVTVLRQAE